MNRVIGATNLPFNSKENKLGALKPKFSAATYDEYLRQKSNTTLNLELVKWENCSCIKNRSSYTIDANILDNVIATYNPNNDSHRKKMNNFRVAMKNDKICNYVVTCLTEIVKNPQKNIKHYRKANLNLKPKKEDEKNPDHFRPLIGLDLISKIISKNIMVRIDEDCDKFNLIDRNVQAAFKGKMERNCHFVYSVFKKRMDLGLNDWVVFFFDLTNAYGTVNFGLLVKIMEQKGFSPEICSYIREYYTGCEYTYLGQTFGWQNGVYQGDPLSRILFMIYIDYVLGVIFQKIANQKLIDCMDISKMTKSFIDDIAMCIPRKNLDKVIGIIFSTCDEFGLAINASKTFFISTNASEMHITLGEKTFKKAGKDFLYLGLPTLCGALEYFDQIAKEIYDSLKVIDEGELTGEQKMYVWYHKIFMAFKRKIDLSFYSTNELPYHTKVGEIFELFCQFGEKWGATITMEKLWKFAILNRGSIVKQFTAHKYHKHLFWDVCPNSASVMLMTEDWSEDVYTLLTGFSVPKDCEKSYEKFVAKTNGVGQEESDLVVKRVQFMRCGYNREDMERKPVTTHRKKRDMSEEELQKWVLSKIDGVNPESEEGVKILNEIFTDIGKQHTSKQSIPKWFWIIGAIGLLYWIAYGFLRSNNGSI